MIKPFKTENEIVYQVSVPIENKPVIVDISYSTGDKGELEFEYSEVSEDNAFDEETTRVFNKVLESGMEERIVNYLAMYYDVKNLDFDPNHYQITK